MQNAVFQVLPRTLNDATFTPNYARNERMSEKSYKRLNRAESEAINNFCIQNSDHRERFTNTKNNSVLPVIFFALFAFSRG